MPKKIGSETVTVRRATKVDRLSDTPAPSAPTHTIAGCVVLPRLNEEDGKGWVIVEGKMVIAPYGVDVVADDEVQVPGEAGWYQVDGKPGPYKNKAGRGRAVIFYLKRLGT
jgi:hypothetical protein